MFKFNIKKLVTVLIIISVVSFSIASVIFLISGDLNKKNYMLLKDKNSTSYNINDEKTDQIANIKEIYVEISSSDIYLIPDKTQDIKCKLYGNTTTNSKPKLETKIDGNKLIIKTAINSSSINIFSSNLKLDIHIPEKYTSDIKIKSSAGSVNLTSPLKLNNLNLNLDSGDINIKNLNASIFDIQCTAGTIKGENINCSTSNIKSVSSNVVLNNFKGSLKADSTSGNITSNFTEFNNNIDIKNTSGDILVTLPKTSQFTLDALAESGNVNCDFPIKIESKSDDSSLKGVVGNSTNKVNLKTTAGNVKLKSK